VVVDTRHQPAFLVGKINSQSATKAKAPDVFRPFFKSDTSVVEGIARHALIDHPSHRLEKIRVARYRDRADKIFVCMGSMASYQRPIASDSRLGSNNAFLQGYQCLSDLEDRPGSVLRHERPVEQGYVGVGADELEVLAVMPAGKHVRIVRRSGDHGEYFSGGGVDSNDTSGLAIHQIFSILLQVDVDGADPILSRNGERIVASFIEGALDNAIYISQKIPHSSFSAKVGLVESFNSTLADLITLAIDSGGIASQLLSCDLADIA